MYTDTASEQNTQRIRGYTLKRQKLHCINRNNNIMLQRDIR